MHQHVICLESDQHFAGRLPTHHLGCLLADLPVAIRGAVSMAPYEIAARLPASNRVGSSMQVTFALPGTQETV